jgi:DHA1 family multidrug resistance protein-like MFS transporter
MGAPARADYDSGMNVARRNFTAIYISHLSTAVGMAAFIPFIPYYMAELGVTDEAERRIWAGLIVAAAPFMAAMVGPVWGALSDRVGRKIMVLRSLLAITLFVGLMGAVTAPWQMLILRLLQGLFSGFVAAGNTLVSVSTPVERQGKTLGVLQTGLLTGFAAGPLVGGLVGDTVGHRPVFVVTAALAAAAFFVVALLAREDREAARTERDDAGLVGGMIRDLAGTLVRREMRFFLGSLFTFRTGLSLMIPVLPVYLIEIGGYPEGYRSTAASLLFVAVAVPLILFVAPWGRRADFHGPGRTFVLCTVLGALLFPPYALAGSALALIVMRATQGVVLAGIMPAAYAAVARLTPATRRGASMGLTQSAMQFAMAFGAAVGGVLAALLGVRVLFLVAAALFLGAAVLARVGWARHVDWIETRAGR